MAMQHADLARLVAKRDQVLAHDPDRLGQIHQIFRHADRLPETPQVFPHGRSPDRRGSIRDPRAARPV